MTHSATQAGRDWPSTSTVYSSVSSMLFAILDAAGYRCGVFTSPHLVDFRERVRTSDGCCSQ